MSTKPNIPIKAQGDQLTAAEFNAVVDHFLQKAEITEIADKTSTESHIASTANPHNTTKAQVGLGNVDNTSDVNKPISSAQQVALNEKADSVHSHVVGDVTGLQGSLDGKAPLSHSHLISDVTNLQSSLDGKVNVVAGKQLSTEDYTTAEKSKLGAIEAGAQVNTVDSVAGKTGVVSLVKADVGLSNVDNTADSTKPISTAQQIALDDKVDKVTGKQLSDENYTLAEKNKLSTIEESKFKGQYVSLTALNTANVGGLGNYAYVDLGVGEDVVKYIWDTTDNKWVLQQGESVEETPASIKSKYESNADTNAFTDSEKANLASNTTVSHTHTNKSILDSIQESLTTALKNAYDSASSWVSTNGATVLSHLGLTNNPHSVTKAQVGLGNVDDTSDINKPISSATQTALNSKANTSHTHVIGDTTGLQGALDSKENAFVKNTAFNKNYGAVADTVTQGNDARLTNAREWTAATIAQAEAEAGAATTRRAWTAQRVRQAILSWWNGSADKTKLDGIESGAQVNTVNSSDLANFETTTQLNSRDIANRSRANHTGTQAISTITDLQAELNAKANNSHTHIVNDITNFDTVINQKFEEEKVLFNINDFEIDEITNTISIKEGASVDLSDYETFTQLNARDVANRSRANHTGSQAISTITDLQAELNAKANNSHTHITSQITDFNTVIEQKFEDEKVLFSIDDFEIDPITGVISLKEGASAETAESIKTKLETLSGEARLDATAIKNLPSGGADIQYEEDVEGIRKLGSTVKAQTMFLKMADTNGEPIFTSGRLELVPVNVKKSDTITGIGYFLVNGNYTANNENRLGLYEASADGNTLTLVASTASNANHWNSGTGWKDRALSANYTVDPTKLYYVGFLFNASAITTAPKVAANAYSLLFSYFNSMLPANRSWARHIAATTLPASIAMTGTTRSIELRYTTLY